MTEDDETKLDVFAVAPDGKFSKFDSQHRAFLPYADLDALVINPATAKPRPGSPEEEAIRAAEQEAKWAAAEERRKRGLDDVIPAERVSGRNRASSFWRCLQTSFTSRVRMRIVYFPLWASGPTDGRACKRPARRPC